MNGNHENNKKAHEKGAQHSAKKSTGYGTLHPLSNLHRYNPHRLT